MITFTARYRFRLFLAASLIAASILFAALFYKLAMVNLLLAIIFAAIAISNPEIGLLIIIFLLPFSWNYVVLKIGNLHIYATYLMVLISGFSLLIRNLNYNIKLYFPRELIYLAIFWLFSVLSILKSSQTMLSIKESIQLFYYIFEFFVVANIVKGESSVKKIVFTIVLCILIVNATATYLYLTGSAEIYQYPEREIMRVGLLSLNPVLFASYLSLSFPILVSLFMGSSSEKIKKSGFFLLAIWTLILILFSYSRGAIVASGIGIIFLILLLNPQNRWKKILFLISLYIVFLTLPSQVSQHLTKTRLEAFDTFVGRIYLSKVAFIMIKDNPVSGIGIGTFPHMLVTTYSDTPFPSHLEKYIQTIRYVADSAHNAFLQYWAEVGTIGFLFFLLAIIKLVKSNIYYLKTIRISKLRETHAGLFSGFLVILMHNLTVTSLSDYFWIFFAVFSSVGATHYVTQSTKKPGVPLKTTIP